MAFTLNYRHFGSGSPVIILHGLLGNHRNWITIGRKISQSYSVFLPDARNHGSSPHENQMDYKDLQNDLSCLIQQNELNDITLIGHSMGGKTAMLFTLDNPDLVNQLIVLDIAPVSYQNDLSELLKIMIALDTTKLSSRSEATTYFEQLIDDDRFNQFLVSNLELVNGQYKWRINLPVIADFIPAIRSFPEVDKEKTYTGSTVFIKGEQSDYILDQHQPIILEKFPNAIFEVIPKSGHNPHVDQPSQLVELLNTIIAN